MKTLAAGIALFIIGLFSSWAQMQTITMDDSVSTNSEVISVPANSTALLKYAFYDGAGCQGYPQLLLNVHGQAHKLGWGTISSALNTLTFTGPATISLQGLAGCGSHAFVTFDVQPGPFPPGKTATVGAYSGNVQVTMEISTDLVNWTPAVNGVVYTNSPDARFFRIRMVTNATP